MVLRRNSAEMIKLEKKNNEFMESNEGAKTYYQLYNKDQNSTLILAIVTRQSTFEDN